MQFNISFVLAFLGDSAKYDIMTCNLIRIIPGILECKFNTKNILIHFSYRINFIHIIAICMKIYAK